MLCNLLSVRLCGVPVEGDILLVMLHQNYKYDVVQTFRVKNLCQGLEDFSEYDTSMLCDLPWRLVGNDGKCIRFSSYLANAHLRLLPLHGMEQHSIGRRAKQGAVGNTCLCPKLALNLALACLSTAE